MPTIAPQARSTLDKSQARYKKEFDKHVRPLKPTKKATESIWAKIFICEGNLVLKAKEELMSNSDGPYPIISVTESTFTITRDRMI